MDNVKVEHQPLLSICIPTYNRAFYLREALDNIISDPTFGDEIEVIISDNASTDYTQQIGEEYSNKYANVHYFRNKENVKDGNFFLCLERATGKYRKLSNDTLRYKSGALSKILAELKKINSNIPILFFNNVSFTTANTHKSVTNIDELINSISYFIGWIAAFGLWTSDLSCLHVNEKYAKLQFVQVAWILEILKQHQNCKLVFGNFYYSREPIKKATYNVFKIHISNLSEVLKDFGLKGLVYERFKYRLFKHYILPIIYTYVYCKQPTGFDTSGMWTILFKEYGYRIYIYPLLLEYKLKSMIRRIISTFREKE